MGAGAATVGGRSSSAKVYEVTNLNDSGTGSLRAAIQASGPRYIVFRVSGLITNKTRLQLGNAFCTIFGQSVPMGGIVLGGKGQSGAALFISTHDVVVRYLTYDGSAPTPTGPDTGTVGFEFASGLINNVILDHCSMRWQGNKSFISYANGQPITNTTVQNCLMAEPNVNHPVSFMTDASSLAEDCVDQDFHHNFHINIGHRIPLYNTKRGRWVSNLVYNWQYFALLAQGGVVMDIIGNKYVRGNLNNGNSNPHPYGFSPVQSTDDTTQKMPGPGSFYLQGNYSDQYQKDPAGDQTVMCAKLNGEGTAELGPPPASWYKPAPLPLQEYPIIAQDLSADITSLDRVLLPTVGNSQRIQGDGTWTSNRDSVDARLVAQYQSMGSGQLFNGQYSSPAVPTGTPWPSSQHDGIADQYKQIMGLDPTDSHLYNKIAPNGLPWIECFQAGITHF
jgi:pectate lyase